MTTHAFSRRRFAITALSVSVVTFTTTASRSGAAQTPSAESGLTIAASTPLLADIVRNVAGMRTQVISVMPDNADPHTWEASPQDIVRATEAASFISIGAHLEPFVESGGWRRAIQDAGIPQLILADHLDLVEVDKVIDHGDHIHDLREGDPHIWLDPLKVVDAIPVIQTHLIEIDPDGASAYATSANAYIAQLQELHAELERDFRAIPQERRVLIVFHDAYTYFAARYGFEVAGVVIKHPEAGDVSAAEIVELQQTIEETGVRVIFAEPQFNTDILSIFVDEQDVTIGELLTDSFSGRVETYLDLMRFNRDNLVTHLYV